jgi:phospholipid transport system substrate-binding protein
LSPFFALLLWLPGTAAAATPADVVDSFHAALIDNMKHAKEYGCDGRIKRLEPIVDSSFDVSLIAQTVMRKRWPELSDAQRSQLIAAFRDTTVVTYASQFNDFGGEVFTTQATDPLPNGDEQVHALLQPSSGDTVRFNYILHGKDDQWRIVNIIADDVSDLSIRSAQYNQIYDKQGFNGLISWLHDQTKKTRASCT